MTLPVFFFDRELQTLNCCSDQKEKGSLKEMIKNRKLVIDLLLMSVCWSVASFGYYMVNSYQKYIKGNLFINNALGSIAEPIGYISSSLFLRCLSLKRLQVASFLACLSFGITLFSNEPVVIATAVFLTRFSNTSAFNLVYLANRALFPSLFLATCFGACNFTARIVTVLSPMVAEVQYPYPAAIFCVLCGLAAFCSLVLMFPEQGKEPE